jgi:hypothetical protein
MTFSRRIISRHARGALFALLCPGVAGSMSCALHTERDSSNREELAADQANLEIEDTDGDCFAAQDPSPIRLRFPGVAAELSTLGTSAVTLEVERDAGYEAAPLHLMVRCERGSSEMYSPALVLVSTQQVSGTTIESYAFDLHDAPAGLFRDPQQVSGSCAAAARFAHGDGLRVELSGPAFYHPDATGAYLFYDETTLHRDWHDGDFANQLQVEPDDEGSITTRVLVVRRGLTDPAAADDATESDLETDPEVE